MTSPFASTRADLSLAVVGPNGLRAAQLGAVLAVAAHRTRSDTQAQVVLPTGVGKTAVAALLPYALKAQRVLIVVPGKLIRGQMAAELETQSRALASGVLEAGAPLPTVAVAEHRATPEDWARWQDADVVVGTPGVLSPGYPGVSGPPDRGFFDLVIFDEAHHLPAATWDVLMKAFDASAVLLTATPFRGDGQRLPGDLVYSYSLRRALDDDVFGEVSYRPVEPIAGQTMDETLARAAADRLNAQKHRKAGSRLLVRTDTVDHAKELVALYKAVGVDLALIVHTTAFRHASTLRRRVESGELSGFACVGALTEGFDFPALKIGVYHRPHKTLAPTLQFVGRLARRGEVVGELLAPRDAVNGETSRLYRSDEAWRDLLPKLVDSAVEHEKDVRDFVREVVTTGPLDISPLSITPQRSVQIYASADPPKTDVSLERIGGSEVVMQFVHEPTASIGFITRRTQRPRFLPLDTLDAEVFELHLVTWVSGHSLLFVSTPSEATRKSLLDQVAKGSLRRGLSSLELRRLLDAARFDRFFSLGKRAARAAAPTSYEIQAGPNTERDLTPADARGWDLGHGIGRVGEHGTFGFSVAKSKVWVPGSADSLFAFRAWCEEQAEHVSSTVNRRRPGSGIDLLGIPEPLVSYPKRPIAATLPTSLLTSGNVISVGTETVAPERLQLVICSADEATIESEVRVADQVLGTVTAKRDGRVSQTGELTVVSATQDEELALADFLEDRPPTFFFADGSRVVGERVMSPPSSVPQVEAGIRRVLDWGGVDITKEFGPAGAPNVNVASRVIDELAAEFSFVVQDHLAREIADFVAFDPQRLEVCLVHCKASSSLSTSARLGDLQELAAQTLRSVQHLEAGANIWLELQRRLKQRKATSIVAGGSAAGSSLIDDWAKQPPLVKWSMWLVQPGLSDGALDAATEASSLLNAVHSWVSSQQIDVRILCSA